MTIDENVDNLPVTQVGSAFHRIRELELRMKYMEQNPELIKQRPDVYVQYRNEFVALFTEGCDKGAWFWYSKNGRLGEE